MALVHMHDMLKHAYDNKYAIGAFDVVNLDMLQGIINAAEACRAPVILGLAEPHREHFDLGLLAPAVEAAARKCSVPVAIHFDHGASLDSAIEGIRCGCNSLMVDASMFDLQENITRTKDVVKMARTCGIAVEAELGYVPENGDDLVFTTAAEAQGFVRHTEVQSLAVSIGTMHGRYKGKPRLDYTRLRQIDDALKSPLVLHGSSGLTDDQFRRLIANGIAKINYFTALIDRAETLLRGNIKKGDANYIEISKGVSKVVEEEADRLMRVWGSAGRAAEVIAQCRPWKLVDHLIKFNLPDSDVADAPLIVNRGKSILAAIPGVREVVTSEALGEDARYRYRWRLTLTSDLVVEQVNKNAEFSAFLKRYLLGPNVKIESVSYRRDSPETA